MVQYFLRYFGNGWTHGHTLACMQSKKRHPAKLASDLITAITCIILKRTKCWYTMERTFSWLCIHAGLKTYIVNEKKDFTHIKNYQRRWKFTTDQGQSWVFLLNTEPYFYVFILFHSWKLICITRTQLPSKSTSLPYIFKKHSYRTFSAFSAQVISLRCFIGTPSQKTPSHTLPC